MSDLEARIVRLEQLFAQILRELRKLQSEVGQGLQGFNAIRNTPGS